MVDLITNKKMGGRIKDEIIKWLEKRIAFKDDDDGDMRSLRHFISSCKNKIKSKICYVKTRNSNEKGCCCMRTMQIDGLRIYFTQIHGCSI